MHEMSIAQSLIEIIKEEMARNDVKILRSVRLQIGQLTAVVPESLSFCFQVMTSGTEMEGANLVMDLVPLQALCRGCKNEFVIENYTFRCPRCEATDLETIAGQELSIVEMEAE